MDDKVGQSLQKGMILEPTLFCILAEMEVKPCVGQYKQIHAREEESHSKQGVQNTFQRDGQGFTE